MNKYPEGAIRTLAEIPKDGVCYAVFVVAHFVPSVKKIIASVSEGTISISTYEGQRWVDECNPQIVANINGFSAFEADHKDFLFLNYWHAYAYIQKLKQNAKSVETP